MPRPLESKLLRSLSLYVPKVVPIGTTFGTYKLSDLSSLLSNGLGIDAGVDLVTVAQTLIGAALSQAQGLSAETLLDKAIGALVDANNGDLRALLAGVDYQAVVGTNVDVLNVVNNIIQHGTIKYVDLIRSTYLMVPCWMMLFTTLSTSTLVPTTAW